MTGETILSMYRRPILSANLRFKAQNDDPGVSRRRPTSCGTAASRACARRRSTRPWAMRRRSTRRPRRRSTRSSTSRPSSSPPRSRTSRPASWTPTAPSAARCICRAGRPICRPRFPPPPAFDEYNSWANLTGSPKADEQASIERGQAIFLNKPLTVANVGGFNDLFPPGPRLQSGHASSRSTARPATACRTPAARSCSRRSATSASAASAAASLERRPGGARVRHRRPRRRRHADLRVRLHGPPASLLRGDGRHQRPRQGADHRQVRRSRQDARCRSCARWRRGRRSSTTAPPRTWTAVVDFYNQRFAINLTAQEKTDLVNFLSAL